MAEFKDPTETTDWINEQLKRQATPTKSGQLVPVDNEVDVKPELERKAWEARQQKAARKWQKRMETVEKVEPERPTTWHQVEPLGLSWRCTRCGLVMDGECSKKPAREPYCDGFII